MATTETLPASAERNALGAFGVLGRISLAQWMLGAAVGGIAFGFVAPEIAPHLKIVSDIFLRLIRAIIAPVLFGVLVRAVGGVGIDPPLMSIPAIASGAGAAGPCAE